MLDTIHCQHTLPVLVCSRTRQQEKADRRGEKEKEKEEARGADEEPYMWGARREGEEEEKRERGHKERDRDTAVFVARERGTAPLCFLPLPCH